MLKVLSVILLLYIAEAEANHPHKHHRQHIVPQPDDDLSCVARAVFREARGSSAGMQAVAHVARNRLHRGWGQSYCHVIKHGHFVHRVAHRQQFSEEFQRGREIARRVVNGELPDNTHGAVFFHAARLRHLPQWASADKRTTRISGNVFYR